MSTPPYLGGLLVIATTWCFGLKLYLLKRDTGDKDSVLSPPQPCHHHGCLLSPGSPTRPQCWLDRFWGSHYKCDEGLVRVP